ncbi:DUF6220 domain-containing protein [Agromyces albus]|uniref:DUF6220 domain-containing protein n=1 Tax=Agromyces albus TaxID=205332 RepID=UPI002781A630|nr:DUF6220 domain-containing protein [Agromyces albus]MDQ0576551.1 hypothetical protein [Agromyces albus]
MRKVFFVLSGLVVLAVVVQFYFAAIGVFSEPEDELSAIHGTNGRMVLPVLIILWIISAALARAGRGTIGLTFLALGLLLFQTVLFILTGLLTGSTPPPDGHVTMSGTIMLGFHAINGLAILWVSTIVLRRSKRLAFSTPARATTPDEEPEAVPSSSP